jgi:hypothetical protein
MRSSSGASRRTRSTTFPTASRTCESRRFRSAWQDGGFRVLDWGDSSISHPFASLVVTFRFLEEITKLLPNDPWFVRLRDAYLEPWGSGLAESFELAFCVGTFAHAFAWARQRDHLAGEERVQFDRPFANVLRRALAYADVS